MTTSYLRDTAEQAGHKSVPLAMHSIGWNEKKQQFVDLFGEPMESIFKLYPWEWMMREQFGLHALSTMGTVQWVEPIWKMMWSNKALLAVLWEMYPNHELLLPAYLDGPHGMQDYVKKPFFGREGAGIVVYCNGVAEPGSEESDVPCVCQQLASLAVEDGNTAILGSWLIDGEPAGVGIRESSSMVTTNTSRFVPHLFR